MAVHIRHMMEYYELSTTKCQSAQQQAFNNDMVVVVQEACQRQGWEFADCFDSKGLRDRIRYVICRRSGKVMDEPIETSCTSQPIELFSPFRFPSCYYKTHIQNAKKRLRTMVRNPTKRANARHLCEHLDLIERHKAAVSVSGSALEDAEPKMKKQRLDLGRRTIHDNPKSRPKAHSDVAGNHPRSCPGSSATDSAGGADRGRHPSATRAPEDGHDPEVPSDPMATSETILEHGNHQGLATSASVPQSSDVASGTRSSTRMMTSRV
jgi:hypothetical protein